MESPVNLEIRNNIAILEICNPPVNALSLSVRKYLMKSLLKAEQDNSVFAIIIVGHGKTFSAGADITEFGTPPMSPILPIICNQIEKSEKPVICSMHGTVLGGGLEMALACHYRLATSKTKLGLPEVHLGLIPGAGGTQRLPRLVGLPEALKIAASGIPVDTKLAKDLKLIDEIIEDIKEGAIIFANQILSSDKAHKRTCDLDHHLIKSPELIDKLSELLSLIHI